MGIKSVNYPHNVPLSNGEYTVSRGDCDQSIEDIFRGEVYGPDDSASVDLAEIARNDIGTGNIEIPNLVSGLEEKSPIPFNVRCSLYNDGLYIVAGTGYVATSTDGEVWNPQPITGTWNDITYGNGLYVIVGYSGPGRILTSSDGLTWTNIQVGVSNDQILTVAYGNNVFWAFSQNITGGVGQGLIYSDDGITWVKSTWTNNIINSVRYINDKFIAVGNGGQIWQNITGAWTQTTSPTTTALYAVAGDDASISIIGGNGYVAVTTNNGSSWTQKSYGVTATMNYLIKANSTFVAVGQSGYAAYSVDGGNTWSSQQIYAGIRWESVLYDGDKFMAFGANGSIATSITGESWEATSLRAIWHGIAYGNGIYVIVGTNENTTAGRPFVGTSEGGSTWDIEQVRTTASRLRAVVYGNGVFVAVGDQGLSTGLYAYSTDGKNWTFNTLTTARLNSVIFENGQFIAVGDDAWISKSVDGVTWNSQTVGSISLNWNDIVFGGGKYVACGNSGQIATSSDASIWNVVTNSTINFTAACYGNGRYILGGNSSRILISDDAIVWSQQNTPISGSINVIKFNASNSVFYFGGSLGAIYETKDLETWSSKNEQAIIHDIYIAGTTFIAVGQYYIYSSIVFYGTFIGDSGMVRDYYVNGDHEETFAYDYNMRWISDIGDQRLNNDLIRNEFIAGQYVTSSIYDIACGNNKLIEVLLNGELIVADNSTNRSLQYWFDTLYSGASVGDIITLRTTYSNGEVFSVDYICTQECYRYVVYYLNKFGSVDPLLIRGKSQEAYTNDQFMINSNYDRSTPSSHQYRVIQNTGLKNITLNTGDLTDAESNKMYHLMPSPKVWLHDLQEGIIYSAYITNPAFTVNKKRVNNTTLNNYTFNLTIAQDIIRRG